MRNHLKSLLGAFAAATAILIGGAMGQQHAPQAAASGVGTVNYVKGYGITLWKQPGAQALNKHLVTGSRWKVFAGAQGSKEYYFNLGGSQYIQSSFLDLDNENSSQSITAVGKVHYVPGYGIAIWTQPKGGHAIAGRTLKHNTAWKVSARQVVNGRVWYQLGKNQWMDGRYFNLTKETARGVKHYAVSPDQLLKQSANRPAPKPSVKPTPKPSTKPSTGWHSDGQTVYLAKTGKKYHFNKNCRGLSHANKSAMRSMTLAQARAKGYTICNYEK